MSYLSSINIKSETVSCSGVSDSLQRHGQQPPRLLCPRDSPGKNTGVGCHALLQGIFADKGWNLHLLHCRQILYHLSYQGIMSTLFQFFNILIGTSLLVVVKTLPSNAGAASSIPVAGAKIPHASQPKNQNIKQKEYWNKCNKVFKSGPHQKKRT